MIRKDNPALELQILQRVAAEINATLDLDEIYDMALRTMDELFEFHHAIILLLEPAGETLRVVVPGYIGAAVALVLIVLLVKFGLPAWRYARDAARALRVSARWRAAIGPVPRASTLSYTGDRDRDLCDRRRVARHLEHIR